MDILSQKSASQNRMDYIYLISLGLWVDFIIHLVDCYFIEMKINGISYLSIIVGIARLCIVGKFTNLIVL